MRPSTKNIQQLALCLVLALSFLSCSAPTEKELELAHYHIIAALPLYGIELLPEQELQTEQILIDAYAQKNPDILVRSSADINTILIPAGLRDMLQKTIEEKGAHYKLDPELLHTLRNAVSVDAFIYRGVIIDLENKTVRVAAYLLSSYSGDVLWEQHGQAGYETSADDQPDYFTAIMTASSKILRDLPKLGNLTRSSSANAYMNRGNMHFFKNEYVQAEQFYRKTVQLNRNLSGSFFNLGLIAAAKPHPSSAVILYTQAIIRDAMVPKHYYYRAKAYIGLRDDRSALVDLNMAIELDPKQQIFFLDRGRLYYRWNYNNETIADMDSALKLGENASAYYIRGNAFDELKQFEEAIRDYDRAVEVDPTFTLAFHNKGRAYYQLGNNEKALESYDLAIASDPESSYPYGGKAAIHKDKGEYEKAIELYTRADDLIQGNGNKIISKNRGQCYQKLKQYDKALADYERALAIDKRYVAAYIGLGEVYGLTGKKQESIAVLSAVLQLAPENVDLYYKRGVMYRSNKEFVAAEKDFSKALELVPDSDNVLLYRCDVYQKLRAFDKALADASRLIEMFPEDPSFYETRSKIYIELKQFENAVEDISRMLEISTGKLSKAFLMRARLYIRMRKYDKASADARVYMDQEGESVDSLQLLGDIHKYKRENEEAFGYYLKSAQLAPDDPYVVGSVAKLYREKGEYESALNLLNGLIERNKAYAWTYFERARVYQRQKKYDLALVDLDQAITGYPTDGSMYYLRGEIYERQRKYEKTLAEYSLAIKHDPGWDKMRDRSNIYLYLNRPDEALQDCILADKMRPGKGSIKREWGRVLVRQGKWAEAYKQFQEAVRLWPESSSCNNLLTLAHVLEGKYDAALAAVTILQNTKEDKVFSLAIVPASIYYAAKRPELAVMIANHYLTREERSCNQWEEQLVQFLAGRITAQELLEKADSDMSSNDTQSERVCEASFYIGMQLHGKGDLEKVKAYMLKCLETNVLHYFEHWKAEMWLCWYKTRSTEGATQ